MIFLDDIEFDVDKIWCKKVIPNLMEREMYDEQLCNVVNQLSLCDERNHELLYPSRFIRISVGDVKKLINWDNVATFCCILPYNYDELANKYLEDNLIFIKFQIELLIAGNKIEECSKLIDAINNNYLKNYLYVL